MAQCYDKVLILQRTLAQFPAPTLVVLGDSSYTGTLALTRTHPHILPRIKNKSILKKMEVPTESGRLAFSMSQTLSQVEFGA